MPIEQVKDDIYVNVEYDGANVACINTDAGLVLIDTPMLPKDINHWQSFLTGLNPKGVQYIIVTHHHFDHIIGNRTFGGKVIMHEIAKDEMLEKNGTLRESMAPYAPGRTAEEIDFILSEPLILPEITFSDELSLCFGNVNFQLIHIGGHTRGSICVYMEKEKALFAGDNITGGYHPYKGNANFKEWIEALQFLSCLDIDLIISGHGVVCEARELDRYIEYFTRLWFRTEHLIKKGKSKDEIIKKVHEEMFGYFKVDPERLEGAKMMFDLGTARLYNEILSEI